ncbi:MAG: hypothetical protein M3P43_13290 [Actinomycetota bacterium]|nr:hypothetical protein [Actinomycetota bacterium]
MPQPLVTGLGLRVPAPAGALPSGIDFETINVNWSELQASAGAAIGGAGKTKIDNAIASGKPFRVRIFCGINAPNFVKAAVGTVTITNPLSGASGTCPKFWRPLHGDYYEDFMTKFEGAYPDGTLSLIFEASCTTVYAEMMIKGLRSATSPSIAQANCTALWNAGYRFDDASKPGDEVRAQERALTIMSGLWGDTRVGFAFSAMEVITSATTATLDESYTLARMLAWRAAMGESFVPQNNSLRDSYIANPSGPRPYRPSLQLFKDIMKVGKPFSFQTGAIVGTTAGFTSLKDTGDFAADMGAHALEGPNGQAYSSAWGGITTSDALIVSAELQANDAPPPATKLRVVSVNAGVKPGQNVPFDVVIESDDASDLPADVAASTGVTLSVQTGSGALSGTVSGTIAAGSSGLTISGVVYDTVESGVVLRATRTSGDSLSFGDSAPFDVDTVADPPPGPDPQDPPPGVLSTQLLISAVNGGAQVHTSESFFVVVHSANDAGVFQDVIADTDIVISLAAGSGTLSGTLTGTILTGRHVVTISGLLYDTAESGVSILADATSGDDLASVIF